MIPQCPKGAFPSIEEWVYPPLAWTEDMIYTTDIYLWVSHGETQYPHSKFLTGQWRSERESKAQPYLEFQNYDWLKKGWFEEWPKYFWHDPEHVGVTAQIQVSAVRKRNIWKQFLREITIKYIVY